MYTATRCDCKQHVHPCPEASPRPPGVFGSWEGTPAIPQVSQPLPLSSPQLQKENDRKSQRETRVEREAVGSPSPRSAGKAPWRISRAEELQSPPSALRAPSPFRRPQPRQPGGCFPTDLRRKSQTTPAPRPGPLADPHRPRGRRAPGIGAGSPAPGGPRTPRRPISSCSGSTSAA